MQAGDLARLTDNAGFAVHFPDWAGQLAIVVEPCDDGYSFRFDRVVLRRLHDGAEDWWYRDQIEEAPDEAGDR